MRVIISSYGSRGDIQPSLCVALELARRGHSVRFVGPPDFKAWLEAKGLEYVSIGPEIGPVLAERLGKDSGLLGLMRFSRELLRSQFEELPGHVRDADILIGGGLQISGPSSAELAGIPYVYLALMPIVFASDEYCPAGLPWAAGPPWFNRLMWRLMYATGFAFLTPFFNPYRRRMKLARVWDANGHIFPVADSVLAADPELGPVAKKYNGVIPSVGACFPEGEGQLNADVEQFLNNGSPPVYIGVGSMDTGVHRGLVETLARTALELGQRVIVCDTTLAPDFAGDSDRHLVVPQVDHGTLFPKVRAVIHHGGAGTTAAAARGGVPQWILPQAFDQFYWASRIKSMALGPAGGPKFPPPDQMRSSIAAVAENLDYRENARALGERVRARRGTQTVADLIEERAARGRGSE